MAYTLDLTWAGTSLNGKIQKIWKLRDEHDPVTGHPIPAPAPIVMPVVNGCIGPIPPELASSNLLASPALSPASTSAASPPTSINISDAVATQLPPNSPAASGAGSTAPANTAAAPPKTPTAARGSIQPHGSASAPDSYPTHVFLTGHFVHVEADLKSGPAADGTYAVISFKVPETMYLRIKPPKSKAASTIERKSRDLAAAGEEGGPASPLQMAAALDPGTGSLPVGGAGANQYGEFTLKGTLDVATGHMVLTKKYGSAKARPRSVKKRRSAVGDLTTCYNEEGGDSDLEGSPTDSAGRRASNRKRHASWRLNETEFVEPSDLEAEKGGGLTGSMSQRKKMMAVKRAAIKRAREEVAAAGGPVYEGGDTDDDDEDYDEMAPPRSKRAAGEGGGRAGLRGAKPPAPTLTPEELAAQKKAQLATAVAEAAAAAFSHEKLAARGRTYVAPHRLAAEAGPLAGDLYEGELLGGRPHGQGTVIYRSGYMFEGRFENGMESGWGVLCDPMDVTVFEGELSQGQLTGYGTFKFESGAMYTGQWRDGLFHGPGAYTQPDGSKFEGTWDLGQLCGSGVAVYADGSMYNGTWMAGKKVGKGQLLRPNGYSYTGGWAEDVPEGKGEATYPDGSTYEGSFRAGKREGRGVYTFGNGNAVLSGRWKDDTLEDSGKGGLDIKLPLQVSEDQWVIPLTLATADVKRIHQRAGFNAGGE